MKCPGCNFVCSELRDICPQCIVDLRPYKAMEGLKVVNPTATYDQLAAKVRSAKKPHPAVDPAKSGSGLADRLIASVGSLWGRTISAPPTPTPTTPSYTPVLAPDDALNQTAQPFDRSFDESDARATDVPAHLETPTVEGRISSWIAHVGTDEESNGRGSIQLASKLGSRPRATKQGSGAQEEPPPPPQATGEAQSSAAASDSSITQESPLDLDDRSSETSLFITTTSFPSLVHATGPAFQWLVPIEESAGEAGMANEHTNDGEGSAYAADNSDTFEVEEPIETAPALESRSSLESDNDAEAAHDDEIDFVIPEMVGEMVLEPSALQSAIPDPIEEPTRPEPPKAVRTIILEEPEPTPPPATVQLAVPASISVSTDLRGIEQAFGGAYCSMQNWGASEELDLSSLTAFSSIDRERVLLLFSQCQDILEGKTPEEPIVEVLTSDNRDVHSEALEAQLAQVEKTIERVHAPAPLRDVAARKGAAQPARPTVTELPVPSAVRRMVVGLFDFIAVALLSAVLASAFERGGLPAVLAEISIDGFTDRHLPIVLSAVALGPLVCIAYLFFSYAFLGNSLPGRMLSIAIRTEGGGPLKLRHLVVRAASTPLALLVGGYLPLLFGRPSLTDRLARTRVHLDVGEISTTAD